MSTKPHYDADISNITHHKVANLDQHELGPRAFNIVWGNDARYWRIPEENGTGSATELVQVSWLELTGSVSVEKGKKYQIRFKLSMKPEAFGWGGSPVFLMAKIGKKGKYTWKRLKQLELCPSEPTFVPDDSDSLVISVPSNAVDSRLYFGLYEVWSGKWKGGLRVHGAAVTEVAP